MTEVLLVDDDSSVLLTLAIALRRRGHRISVASDGLGALEHLRHNTTSVVVSDVRMPGMNGVELAHLLHQLRCPPRVILTSAYSNMPLLGEDVQGFVPKPIDVDLLNSLLAEPEADSTVETGPTPPKSQVQKKAGHSPRCRPVASQQNRPVARMPRPSVPAVN